MQVHSKAGLFIFLNFVDSSVKEKKLNADKECSAVKCNVF